MTLDLQPGFTRLEPQTGTHLRLAAGDVLTIVDPSGVQVSDLYCVAADDIAETLSSGRSIDFENTIRSRDLELQGSLNPMVADHGAASEARQYSGRAVSDSWLAPLEVVDDRDTACSAS
jgi:uncharacterized protein YcgI (DUF1989 family)